MDFGLKKLKTHRENTDKKLIKKAVLNTSP